MEMVVKALLDLKNLFPPRLRKAITVKEFHNRCLMTRIEDDNQCLQDFFWMKGVLNSLTAGSILQLSALFGSAIFPCLQ